jgi:hypothetical protein
MLYLALIVIVQIACVVHCIQKRRNPWWIVGILLFPLIGSAAYVIVEVLPGRELRMAKAAAPLARRSPPPTPRPIGRGWAMRLPSRRIGEKPRFTISWRWRRRRSAIARSS